VVGIPARVVSINGISVEQEDAEILEHGRLPDPVEQAITALNERVARLEEELARARSTP
jgi:serine O-acetyltransferase